MSVFFSGTFRLATWRSIIPSMANGVLQMTAGNSQIAVDAVTKAQEFTVFRGLPIAAPDRLCKRSG